ILSCTRAPSSHWRQHMRRFGFTAAFVASLAIVATIANCSSDNHSSNPVSAPSDEPAQLASANLSGGGWSPAVAAAAATNDKVTVCHSGNDKHFVQITVSAQG